MSPIVQAIDNFKTTTSFVDNLSNGNNYEAGKIAGGKSGEGVLQGGVMLVTAGVVKVAGTGSATLFRAVSSAELTDAAANGVRNTATGYQTGKLFATTASDAAQYGKSNFGLDGIPNTIMKVKVPNSVMKTAYVGEMDGMKAVSIPTNQLPQVKVLGPLNYSPKPTNPYKFPGAW